MRIENFMWLSSTLLCRCGFLFAALLLAEGCGHRKPNHSSPSSLPTGEESSVPKEADKRWWLEKTVRLLRNGDSIRSPEELAQLMAKSNKEVVQDLLSDEQFYNVMVDFNLFYLGIRSDNLKFPPSKKALLGWEVLNRPQAIEGALRIKEGADFFGMFSNEARQYTLPLGEILAPNSTSLLGDSKKLRAEGYVKILNWIDGFIASSKQGKMPSNDAFCKIDGKIFEDYLFELRIPNTIAIHLAESSLPCENLKFLNAENAVQRLTVIRQEFVDVFAYLDTIEPEIYHPTKLSELRPLDKKKINDDSGLDSQALFWFWLSLKNSSTNENRRRASYVLKRFFCDDLTPINVVSPKLHAGTNRHASEPSCQACHYKLDPMAG
ncbi:MAG: hypothetical protein NTX25_12505, partial [Proteobacteria bacterium]|nr:hypothetical protein [Pseudomonadota bacterium]